MSLFGVGVQTGMAGAGAGDGTGGICLSDLISSAGGLPKGAELHSAYDLCDEFCPGPVVPLNVAQRQCLALYDFAMGTWRRAGCSVLLCGWLEPGPPPPVDAASPLYDAARAHYEYNVVFVFRPGLSAVRVPVGCLARLWSGMCREGDPYMNAVLDLKRGGDACVYASEGPEVQRRMDAKIVRTLCPCPTSGASFHEVASWALSRVLCPVDFGFGLGHVLSSVHGAVTSAMNKAKEVGKKLKDFHDWVKKNKDTIERLKKIYKQLSKGEGPQAFSEAAEGMGVPAEFIEPLAEMLEVAGDVGGPGGHTLVRGAGALSSFESFVSCGDVYACPGPAYMLQSLVGDGVPTGGDMHDHSAHSWCLGLRALRNPLLLSGLGRCSATAVLPCDRSWVSRGLHPSVHGHDALEQTRVCHLGGGVSVEAHLASSSGTLHGDLNVLDQIDVSPLVPCLVHHGGSIRHVEVLMSGASRGKILCLCTG